MAHGHLVFSFFFFLFFSEKIRLDISLKNENDKTNATLVNYIPGIQSI